MVWDVNFSPDGRFLASIDQQGQFIIWATEVYQIFKFKQSLYLISHFKKSGLEDYFPVHDALPRL